MRCVVSYFKTYFDPEGEAPLRNHSAGLIARYIYEALKDYGDVRYFGAEENPSGIKADVFIGHFWSFADTCDRNRFDYKVAFYSVSDPTETRQLLETLAGRFGVPVPYWDLPPAGFDHERTMELADLVLVVGNSYTFHTFPKRWHHKIRLLNYTVDPELYNSIPTSERRNEFCYVATHCGLRKGFMDILKTWHTIDTRMTRLHVIGKLDPPWDRLLEQHNNGSIVNHGWIDSHTTHYQQIIRSCKYAHIPTYSEGQMGTLLETIFSGCVPITTRASGIDDRLLEHCLVVNPLKIDDQRKAIDEALSWSDDEYEDRSQRLIAAAHHYHNWTGFKDGIKSALKPLEEFQPA